MPKPIKLSDNFLRSLPPNATIFQQDGRFYVVVPERGRLVRLPVNRDGRNWAPMAKSDPVVQELFLAPTLMRHRTVLKPAWRRVTPWFVYPKRCYERTLAFVLGNMDAPPPPFSKKDIRLVHGQYKGFDGVGPGAGHAWVMVNDRVIFDGVLQEFFEAHEYLRAVNGVPSTTYGIEEVCDLVGSTGNHGPWQDA